MSEDLIALLSSQCSVVALHECLISHQHDFAQTCQQTGLSTEAVMELLATGAIQ